MAQSVVTFAVLPKDANKVPSWQQGWNDVQIRPQIQVFLLFLHQVYPNLREKKGQPRNPAVF